MSMSIHEIETQLISEGLAPYSMTSRSMREGESARMGESGEYDIADYMEGDNSPEAQALIEELEAMGHDFLADEYGLEEAEDEAPVEDDEPITTAWDFLRA